MKKFKNLLLITAFLFVCFISKTSARSYTQVEVISRVNSAGDVAQTIVSDLTDWSNSYASSVKGIYSKAFIHKFDSLDYSKSIDLVIDELKRNGYTEASDSLLSIKPRLVSNLDYLKETLRITEDYLNSHVSGGVTGSLDLFIELRSEIKKLKSPVKNLVKIYYDMYYDSAKSRVNSLNSVADARRLFDLALDEFDRVNDIYSKYEEKINKWQNLYNLYHLEDYDDYFKEIFSDYYKKIKEDYYKLYNKIEKKLQSMLDNRIDIIDSTVLPFESETKIEANNKLYEIMDYIKEVEDKINARFATINSKIKINSPMISKYFYPYEKEIIDRLEEAYKYTEAHLYGGYPIELKNESDSSFIKIDHLFEFIYYDAKDLNLKKFVNKFESDYGTIVAEDKHNNRLATGTYIFVMRNNSEYAHYKVIVKGDVSSNGVIDITDVVKACDQMFKKIQLDSLQFMAADMNSDGKVNITDIVKICDKIFK